MAGLDSGESFGEEVWEAKGSEGGRFVTDFIFRMNCRYWVIFLLVVSVSVVKGTTDLSVF